ncbi:hypothetical protein FRC19_005881 [Serendipita sp. 401]|nr:hypothetical protein FRC19_005881 [Serendipita sp. 401]
MNSASSFKSRSSSPAQPTVPTPPWLLSPLPSFSDSEQDKSAIPSAQNVSEAPLPTIVPASLPSPRRGMKPASFVPEPMMSDPKVILRGVTEADFDTDSPAPESGCARSVSPPDEPEPDRLQATGLFHGTMQPLGPLTCTTLTSHDALMLRCQLHHDPHRLQVLGNVLRSMQELKMPNHDVVWNLLVVTEGGYNCPFPQCPRHEEGWTRADRTRAHIYADHLLIRYKCSQCNSYFKREQDFNIHVASHDKQPAFECTVCNKSFPKKFNLNRHLRQIHDQRPVIKIRQVAPGTK